MRTRNAIVLVGLLAIPAAFACASGKVGGWIARVASDDEDVREKALVEHQNRRTTQVKALLAVVSRPVKKGETFYVDSPRNSAMHALGTMRASEASDELIKWVTPRPGQDTVRTELTEGSPAQRALASIGLPAVPALTKSLLKAKNKAHALEFARTVEMIKGRVEATAYFQRLLIGAKNASKRKNVRTALDFCEELRKYEQKIKAEQEELSRKK